MASCLHCGGQVTLIATIDDSEVIVKILAHLGLPTKAPPRGPAQPCPLFQTAYPNFPGLLAHLRSVKQYPVCKGWTKAGKVFLAA